MNVDHMHMDVGLSTGALAIHQQPSLQRKVNCPFWKGKLKTC